MVQFEKLRWTHWIIAFFLACLFSTSAYSQAVTESWLRQAGITCGGGLSYEVQGEIDTEILNRFSLAQGEVEGRLQLSETERLLMQFKENEKRETYVDYVNCMLQLMNLATDASGLPPEEVVLDSPVAVAGLETIKRGQMFVMTPGDTYAISGHQLLFTVDKIELYREKPIVYFTWSNTETDTGESSANRYQAQPIAMGEGCKITPYKIEPEESQVSFLSNC